MPRLSMVLVAFCLTTVIVEIVGKTVQVDNVNLDCTPPAKFTGKDDQAKCFARCKERDCLAAIYHYDGPPNRPTCAIIPKNATCLPGEPGPYNVQLNVPVYDFSYRTSHTLDMLHEKKLFGSSQVPGCSAFCGMVKGCNAVRSSPMTCQLLQLTGKQTALRNGFGTGPLCHNFEWVYYVDKTQAPTEKGCEIMTS
ncbi:uncharacterized protein LOC129600989 [Paramacrobiotus metropolitanus]|uniref:uncharacterized protein LOC129600989 n=1 Tax=Paramacrobiotus metropolitanus TaxID=2943436 RepID=UPI0024460C73|nr:uncharacterized protein LOC129600989 [Paramacrobiotus metropolitanus]